MAAQAMFYNPSHQFQQFFKVQDKWYNLGIYYKYNFSTSRNFATDIKIGGYGGTNTSTFMFYPYGEITQSFWIGPQFQLVVGEQAAYLFNTKETEQFKQRWLGVLNVGLKFSL